EVAALLGAEAVVSTATDGAGLPALDLLPGFGVAGDVASVTRAWLDGSPPSVDVDPALVAWPLPAALADLRPTPAGPAPPGPGSPSVLGTDRAVEPAAGQVVLRPPAPIRTGSTGSLWRRWPRPGCRPVPSGAWPPSTAGPGSPPSWSWRRRSA